MSDDTGESGIGPSWKWIVTIISAITVPLIGAILLWIADNLQSLVEAAPMINYRMDAATKQLDDIYTQLRTINATLGQEQNARQQDEYKMQAFDARIKTLEDNDGTDHDWIVAQIHANRAINEARQAEHPRQRR